MRRLRRIAVLLTAAALAGCDRDVSSISGPPEGHTLVPNRDVSATAVTTPQISGGAWATCALRANGAIVCWGADVFGLVSGAPSGTYTQMDVTYYTGCAVSTAGGVSCWGLDAHGQTEPPPLPAGLTYTRVSVGFTAACAIRSDAAIVCWGLVDPEITNAVPAGAFSDISVSESHACAVTTAGPLTCWGNDTFGQLTNVPAAPAGRKFTNVEVGNYHSCALLDDGTARCWGDNKNGQLNVPALPAGVAYTDIATNYTPAVGDQAYLYTCAARSDGQVLCWGANAADQLSVPPLPAGMVYTSVTVGSGQACSVRSDGAPICWGLNGDGQASPPPSLNLVKDPQTIVFTPSVPSEVTTGTSFTLVPNAGSGEPLVLASSTPTICTISGTTLSFIEGGTCTFTANRAGNATYTAAPELVTSVNVVEGRLTQSITFTSTPPDPAYVNATYSVAATGGASGNPVTFTSLTTSTCTVSGSTVTFVGAAECKIAANQAGNASYFAAPQATQTINVQRRPQSITFAPAVPSEGLLGSQITVGATGGGSLNPVVISVLTPSTCSLTAGTLTLTSVGNCIVQATQAGNVAYNPAPTVTATVAVRWPFTGFVGLAAAPTLNRPNAGSSVEAPFSLGGNRGMAVLAAGSPTAAVYTCSATPPAPGSGTTARTPGASALIYNAETGLYTFTWKSDKAWTNRCVQLSVKLADGSVHTALFQFR